MTLVVCKIVENSIFIESDTRITVPDIAKNDPLCGVLKTVILNPFICLSYAGLVHFAEKAIKRFFDEKINDLATLIKMLIEVHNESKQQTDFVLASIFERKPRLFKIAQGKFEKEINSAWLGDVEGYDVFQKEFYQNNKSGKPIPESLGLAFKKVLEDPSIKSIGDFHISTHIDYDIAPQHPVFLHSLKCEIIATEKQTIKIDKGGEWKPVPLGTTAGGSYGISYLVTVSPNFHGVAIHFPHGKFGVLFCPQLGFKGIVISRVNGRQFVCKIKEKYNISLRGFIMNTAYSMQYIDNRDL